MEVERVRKLQLTLGYSFNINHMYTLKSSQFKRLNPAELADVSALRQEPIVGGRLFQLYLTFTLTKGDGNDISVSTFIDTEADAINAINQNLARLNAQEVLLAKVADDTFTIVVPEPVVVEPTAEELERAAIEAKRAILREAKADVEIGLLTAAEFEAKVTAVKAPSVRAK
jgi:hypothetical protein